jgi:hypothetical protein
VELEKNSGAGQAKAKHRKCSSEPYISQVNSEPYKKM